MDEEQEQKTHQISKTSFGFMLVIAVLGDIASFFLGLITVDAGILNDTLAFLMDMGIWFWAALNGMGLKGAATGGISMVIEIIPIVGSLPTFTAAVIALFIMSRVKEVLPIPESAKGLVKKI